MHAASVPRLNELSRHPLVVAPMAGVSSPELVVAVAGAGAMGVLADRAFGVNVFVPGTPTDDRVAVERFVDSLGPTARDLGATPGEPVWDDDSWQQKLEILLVESPAVVSFTFGCPSPEIMAEFVDRGVHVTVTVTTPQEAQTATRAGAASLCVQGVEAGGHRASFANRPTAAHEMGLHDLLGQVLRVTNLPVVAAGGLVGPDDVARVLRAGAVAAQLGTAFLRSDESAAPRAHKDALGDPASPDTALTRAFSGRPARSIRNEFMSLHPDAPIAYPEINNATRPLRAAAAARGDRDAMSLYAGTGFRQALERPAAQIVELLASGVPQLEK